MARRKSKKNTKKIASLIVALILAFFVYEARNLNTVNVNTSEFAKGDAVYVHFIDVGQGSSTLIQDGTTGILIDAGERDYGETVVEYLENCGINELEYVIASHPHSDHIGGMTDVIEAYPNIGCVVMPELEEFNTPTTRVYEDLLLSIYDKDIDTDFVLTDKGSRGYGLNNKIDVEILGPTEQVEDLNNMSLVCRVLAENTTFMILGDAEKRELSGVYKKPLNATATAIDTNPFKSDIIAMGHHGSSTSIYEPFLDAVNADVAVISCGKNNSYGHPHEEALEYIENSNMTCLRTDIMGSVVFKVTDEGYSLVEN